MSRDTRPKNMVAMKRQLSLINWAEELQSKSYKVTLVVKTWIHSLKK